MKANRLFTLFAVLTMTACASAGKAGDACTTDDDCEDGLECHVEGHDDHADHDDHDDDDHDDEDHDDEDHGDEEEGTCEEEDAE